ncbi:ArsR/SmtB family transcription factor [Pseudomonas typographi]|uniref:Helix-turn-helix transcriptional regulator n=1 Tax=Pseudomonas typographi TaxID=2715964 RepID=A0ABR7Z7H0_9PSED|nr:helix-turn-helix transcriptional regulator [Pseudomonas typographi]MBD1589432.1 helix-turn-helix transcriptional regulator [Pseudomonas typographi]MBD1601489.1 helix-turn-helix transcriptional regulator [Pseudomonas typographi]
MEYAPSISHIATLIADPKRSALLWALIDGATRGADELARLAGVSSSSAGAHLSRLSAAGLLTHEARGRKRFFRLANPEVGVAVEALASASAQSNARPVLADAPLAPATAAMRQARLCGEHLGGMVAAQMYRNLLEAGWVRSDDYCTSITPAGSAGLANLGIYVQALPRANRLEVQTCCDWCESGPHIGGVLGTSLLRLCLQRQWLARHESTRAFRVTPQGQRGLASLGRGAI